MEPSAGACKQGMAKLKRSAKCAWLVSPSGPARTKRIPALSGGAGAGAPTKATEGTRAVAAAKATEGARDVTAAKAATDGKRKRAVAAAKRKV